MTRPSHLRGSVVLLSGGMDSATCLAQAARSEPPVHALTVVYGQRHAREIESARRLARHFRVAEHRVIRLQIRALLSSALTDRRRRLPQGRDPRRGGRIPVTYVPARNTILLALALAFAESRRCASIYIGANAIDYSGYPDCRPEYLAAFARLARRATKAAVEEHRPVRIVAPLLRLSKAGIVRRGERLHVPWALTWSCYAGGRSPCGRCDACRLREKGFDESGIRDPVRRPPSTLTRGGRTYRTRNASL